MALSRCGVTVERIDPRVGKLAKMVSAARNFVAGYGQSTDYAQLLRSLPARRMHATQLEAAIVGRGVTHMLHTGIFDLPLRVREGVKHYLYCDHTCADARVHRAAIDSSSERTLREYERLEFATLIRLDHIFTCSRFVRDRIISHYGVPADRVTVVGAGMGNIEPFAGRKDYKNGGLLFVAEHLFREKGGELLIEAFVMARRKVPGLRLTIVGDERSRRYVSDFPDIDFRPKVTRAELLGLYRKAALLAQPMLSDPWGQVYLEALVSRTPVLGLNRNGLPEITDAGRYGFLVDQAEPWQVADAIVNAMGDPERLAWMGAAGQRHVLRRYRWDVVADKMVYD
jgi:glycosyltransferase involved in cell wall biosynthesis